MKGRGPCQINPDLWYPEMPRGKPTTESVMAVANNVRLALDICGTCPAKWKCEEEGMKPENLAFGIWGGTMAGERLVESGGTVAGLR